MSRSTWHKTEGGTQNYTFPETKSCIVANCLTTLDETFRDPCQYQYTDRIEIIAQSVEECGSCGNFSELPFVILPPSPPDPSWMQTAEWNRVKVWNPSRSCDSRVKSRQSVKSFTFLWCDSRVKSRFTRACVLLPSNSTENAWSWPRALCLHQRHTLKPNKRDVRLLINIRSVHMEQDTVCRHEILLSSLLPSIPRLLRSSVALGHILFSFLLVSNHNPQVSDSPCLRGTVVSRICPTQVSLRASVAAITPPPSRSIETPFFTTSSSSFIARSCCPAWQPTVSSSIWASPREKCLGIKSFSLLTWPYATWGSPSSNWNRCLTFPGAAPWNAHSELEFRWVSGASTNEWVLCMVYV